MKVVVFGATGTIGTYLVEQLLAAGHAVTAFGRDPSRLSVSDRQLAFVQGDVLSDQDRVRAAVTGQDAVLVALGGGLRGRVRAEGTHSIVAAMKEVGTRRLVCQTTLGGGDSFDNLDFKWRMIFRLPLRWALSDHERQEACVRRSELDWTIVRPAAFTDGPLTGDYQHGFPGTARGLTLTISRADVAHFMIDQLTDGHYRGRCVSISY